MFILFYTFIVGEVYSHGLDAGGFVGTIEGVFAIAEEFDEGGGAGFRGSEVDEFVLVVDKDATVGEEWGVVG